MMLSTCAAGRTLPPAQGLPSRRTYGGKARQQAGNQCALQPLVADEAVESGAAVRQGDKKLDGSLPHGAALY